ncbi:MAG: LPS export ABC transporter periplasmic protein LptC [Phenylobacterium sp.]
MSSPTADLPGHGLPGVAAEDIERRRRLLRRWRRHSFLIAILRRLLPALCLAIIVALGAWSAMSTFLWRKDVKVRTDADISMRGLVFQGRTDSGKPFLVTSANATRDSADTAKVTLEHPLLTVDSGGPEWTKITAVSGVYREDTKILDLKGQVMLDDYKGNHLVTEHALVDTTKNNVDGDTRISGRGPLGSIDASSYSLRGGGAYLLFQGRVKSVIQHHAQATGAAPLAGH